MGMLGLLLQMLTIPVLLAALVSGTIYLISRRRGFSWWLLVLCAGWLAVYVVVLLGASFTSQDKVLNLRESKRFCGFYLDCDLTASVVSVTTAKTVGPAQSPLTAQGTYYVVTVAVSNEAERAPAHLGDPQAIVRDAQGHEYPRSPQAERALAATGQITVPSSPEVPAGNSLIANMVFDLPTNVQSPMMYFTVGDTLERTFETFLPGDEDSLLHKRAWMRLEPHQ
jgi:Domain of unknown function (DUF4352)